MEDSKGLEFLESVLRYLYYTTEISSKEVVRTLKIISEEGGERAMTTAEKLIEKGVEKGVEKGMEKGVEKGVEEGIEKGMRDALNKMINSGISEGEAKKILGMN